MNTIKALIKRHPLLSYFALTFAITWGLFVLAVGGPGGIPATRVQFTTIPLGAILAVLVGPSASGILLTGLVHGRAGFRDLFREDEEMAGWRSLVRGGAPDRTARVHGGTYSAVANLPGIPPRHIRI